MLIDFRCARTGDRHLIDVDSVIDVIQVKATYTNTEINRVLVVSSELQDSGDVSESIRLLVDKDDAARVLAEWIEAHGPDAGACCPDALGDDQ